MLDPQIFDPAAQALKDANSYLILLPPEPSKDLVAAGLSLFYILSSENKPVQIGCSGPIKIDSENLSGLEDIQTTVGNQNLQIAFDFAESDLEKVDYDVDPNGKFILFIKPKTGHRPPDIKDVKFSYSGASSDLVFVLGINSLPELGKLYADEKSFLDSAKIVSIKTALQPSQFAALSLFQPASSVSEIVATFAKQAKLHLSADAANNLLTAISEATRHFSSKATADTFEIIAHLIRSGATLHQDYTSPPVPTFVAPKSNQGDSADKKSKIFKLDRSAPISISPDPISQA
jgi:nanoRNase/pAp phosphatase (c-di-AMP/oligoRNAs hydrolase)